MLCFRLDVEATGLHQFAGENKVGIFSFHLVKNELLLKIRLAIG